MRSCCGRIEKISGRIHSKHLRVPSGRDGEGRRFECPRTRIQARCTGPSEARTRGTGGTGETGNEETEVRSDHSTSEGHQRRISSDAEWPSEDASVLDHQRLLRRSGTAALNQTNPIPKKLGSYVFASSHLDIKQVKTSFLLTS